MVKPVKTDVVIIGSGLAGSIAAITAANEGKNVIIITKTKNLKSGNSPYAQGGIVYKVKKLRKSIFIGPGRPLREWLQTALQSGKLRGEHLNGEFFYSLKEV